MKQPILLKRVLILYITFFSSLLMAQSGIAIPGWILKNGEEIKGNIYVENWYKNPEYIYFSSNDGKKLSYTASTIEKFGTDDGEHLYISYEINIDITHKSNLSLEEREKLEDVVFLKVLQEGEADLYFFNDKNANSHFFTTKSDQALELLIYASKPTQVGEKKIMQTDEAYKVQLDIKFRDCESIKEQIAQTSYNAKSLNKLFKAYLDCKNVEPNYSINYSKNHIYHGPQLGLAMTQTSARLEPHPNLGIADFGNKLTPRLGYFFIFNRGSKLAKYAIRFSVNYGILNISGLETVNFVPLSGIEPYDVTYDVNMKFHNVHVKGGFQYYVSRGTNKPYIFGDLGVAGIVNTAINEVHQATLRFGMTSEETLIAYDRVKSIRYAADGGFGFARNRIFLELGVEWDNGISPYAAYPDQNLSYFFTAGYSLH